MSGDSDLRYDISQIIQLKHLTVLKDPWDGLNIERYFSWVRIKYFNSIMVETGNTTTLIVGSVDVVIRTR
jgi:hypothetical protein